MNLTEAFKVLDSLTEDTFDLDQAGIAKLSDFEGDNFQDDTIMVIDAKANTEDELKNSYVGKVILDCQVCHSKQYKDKEDVVLDDTHTLANVGEECPYCYASDGFKVIGEVVEFPAEFKKEYGVNEKLMTSKHIKKASKKSKSIKEGIKSDIYSAVAKHFDYSVNSEFADLIADLVDRALLEEGDDIDESITSAIDEGLIYNKDIWTVKEFYEEAALDDSTYEELFNDMYSIISSIKDEDLEEKCLNEDIKDISITTDDTHMSMSTEENGKVVVTSEPVEKESCEKCKEVIKPISDETKDEIEAEDEVEGEDDMIDFDIDEFDEKSFDELGERYLKKVYENVNSFKCTNVSTKKDKLIVEGKVNFASGKVSPTRFVFEACNATKDGRVSFVGHNKNITRGNKAFTLNGVVKNKNLIAESFKYNYMSKNPEGKSSRIYGTIKKI